jgi:gliding motility-associated-like protein
MSRVKFIWLLICFLTCACSATIIAQNPQILFVDKAYATPSQVVSITGTGFGTNASQLAVYFGGTKGVINNVTDQLIEVQAPFGTTYNKISVFNTTSGLGSFSEEPFFLDFGGTHPLNVSNLKSQVDFAADAGLYDQCLCDFDGDYKLDVATANSGSNNITLLKNGSSVGSFSFIKSSPSVGTGTIHVQCGDLNGDGLPDLVISETNGGTRLFVFKNLGGFSFNMSTITLTGKKVKQIQIADLDGDGRSELIVTDQGNPSLIILPNLSTVSSINFGTPSTIKITGAASSDGLAIEDLNGDHLPEIITTKFLTGNGDATVLVNQSVQGSFNFGNQVTLKIPGTLVDLKVGDLDGDGLPEIAATQLLGSSVSIFLNQSSTSIQFAAAQTVAVDDHPYGLDFGDLDGDGKPDIVVASITKKTLSILNNSSSIGSLSFTSSIIPTTYINRHVKIADMDGDAKPDITFTSIDDNNNNISASKVSIIRNASCMTPVVAANSPTTICNGNSVRLSATINGGVAYQWYKNGTAIPSATNSYYDATATGQFTVTATAEGGACSTTSNQTSVTVSTGSALSTANPINNGPICAKSTLQLSVADVGASQYVWRGPNGYTGSGLTPLAVTNFSDLNAGRYYLDVYSGSCLAQQTSTIVQAVQFPSFKLSSSSSGLVCQGQTVTLSVVPGVSNVSYQWFEKNSGVIAGQTNPSLTVSTVGNYFGKVSSTIYSSCPSAFSDTVSVQVVSQPVADFNVSASTPCSGQLITFNNQSTSDSQTTPIYNWDFGDTTNSTDQSPTHSYATAGAFTAKLTVNYAGGICAQTKSQTISVTAAPPLTITSSSGSFTFCQGQTITLNASSSGFDQSSYQWSNSATGLSTSITTDGTYSVSAKASSGGCSITASQLVTLLPLPEMTISGASSAVSSGQTVQLIATGLATYIWSPGKTLSDSTIANPVATPIATTLYKVKGKGVNGCVGVDSILVNLNGEGVTGKLKPQNFFSPGNGDLINEKWEVAAIANYPQCGVTIYDEKGLKVFESKPYLNNWDGTFNGHLLPIGVYYYIIRCDGDSTPKTGSITLIR